MRAIVRMQDGEDGPVTTETVTLKLRAQTGSALIEAARQHSEGKGLVLLSVRPLNAMTKPETPRVVALRPKSDLN